MVVETLNHVIQQCHRTHGARVKRHDAIVQYVARSLKNRAFAVDVEPHIKTPDGLRKPDVVAVKGEDGYIIDAQVVSEQSDLERANRLKVSKYADNIPLVETIKNTRGVKNLKVLAVTINCRGVWSRSSSEALQASGVITTSDIKVLSSRAIIGGLAAFNQFNKTTVVRTYDRTGIG